MGSFIGYRGKYAPKYNGFKPKVIIELLGVVLNHKEISLECIHEYQYRYDYYFLSLFKKQDNEAISLYFDMAKHYFNQL